MKISVVIPCYNEGNKLYKNVHEVNDHLAKLGHEYEIIVSNDGSKDTTVSEVHRIQQELPNVKLIDSNPNRGKGHAVKLGMLESTGDVVFFMDADLSTNLKAIDDALPHFEEYDVVIGSRRIDSTYVKEKQPWIRRFIGKTASIIVDFLVPLHIRDTQCGFKGFKKNVCHLAFSKQTVDGFAFDVEVLYIASLYKHKIKEIPVIWINDTDSTVKVVRDSYRFFKALFKIRSNKRKYLK